MSAFKDSGHRWWQQCPACGMAWFIGEAPEDEDAEVECNRCAEDAASEDREATARAEGYAQAREQAAKMLEWDRDMSTPDVQCDPWDVLTGAADDIRAMQPKEG